jgi:hypothetical protein
MSGNPPGTAVIDRTTLAFYRDAMKVLDGRGIRFLVGGAYAFARYTGIERHTKDFDIFVSPADVGAALEALAAAGYRTELTFPHWLGKAHCGEAFVDVIFSSGNAVAEVDEEWFEHAPSAEVLGHPVKLCPPEEMLWSKSFIMERERYDGADVLHLFRQLGDTLDWDRLLRRFGRHWRVLFSSVVLFGFVYPAERSRIPARVVDELSRRFAEERPDDDAARGICDGTILSREQYLVDVHAWGYADGRLAPRGSMTAREISDWTTAIGKIA